MKKILALSSLSISIISFCSSPQSPRNKLNPANLSLAIPLIPGNAHAKSSSEQPFHGAWGKDEKEHLEATTSSAQPMGINVSQAVADGNAAAHKNPTALQANNHERQQNNKLDKELMEAIKDADGVRIKKRLDELKGTNNTAVLYESLAKASYGLFGRLSFGETDSLLYKSIAGSSLPYKTFNTISKSNFKS